MSILIKGMEMPKRGYLALNIYPDGRVACNLDANCAKAVPVPPHGRLIDADALINDGWSLHKQVIRMGGYAIHEMPLSNPDVPTIIEAEDE